MIITDLIHFNFQMLFIIRQKVINSVSVKIVKTTKCREKNCIILFNLSILNVK